MRILILSDINSAHTQKWVLALSRKGIEVGVFSLSAPVSDWYSSEKNISILSVSSISNTTFNSPSGSKLSYLKVLPALKKAIKQYCPDIVHAHYATSYGLLGALTGFQPFVISAWGSDVMDFPNRSFLHKKILAYNLKKANIVLATSEAIIQAIEKVVLVPTKRIPFGIDLSVFKPSEVKRPFSDDTIVIGTIKTIAPIYGTDILINAFKKVKDDHPAKVLKLLIVGSGVMEPQIRKMVTDLKLANDVLFTGKVSYEKVPEYHNMIDIFVNVSRNESFGVSVIEASACERAVIVSNVGGLKEVVINNETGFLVEPESIDETSKAIQKLFDKSTREEFGRKGREMVMKQFSFDDNLNDTIAVYAQLLKNK